MTTETTPGLQGFASGDESKCEALTRLLAIESRNALARVELAASELGRFETTPSVEDRLATIHDAVDQIDSLLAKIDVLASPRNSTVWPAISIVDVWHRIRHRLESTLSARGIELIIDSSPREVDPGWLPNLEMPEPVLESIFYAGLRLVLASTDRDGRLRVEWSRTAGELCVGLAALDSADGHGSGALRRHDVNREDALELEVQLAEWRGRLVAHSELNINQIQIVLPVSSLDDG